VCENVVALHKCLNPMLLVLNIFMKKTIISAVFYVAFRSNQIKIS